jgi:plasmid maintenance system antidote protein VapI
MQGGGMRYTVSPAMYTAVMLHAVLYKILMRLYAKIYTVASSVLAVAPGIDLQMELEGRQVKPSDFAKRIGMSLEDLERLFEGQLRVGRHIAQALADELGIPAQLWLDLERDFRAYHG